MQTLSALWKCEKCGRPFANRNQTHSCGLFNVGQFLAGRSAEEVNLYNTFAAAIEQLGDVITAPAKTRVGFQVRMIFACVNRLNDDGLFAHVCWRGDWNLPDSLKSNRFRRATMCIIS